MEYNKKYYNLNLFSIFNSNRSLRCLSRIAF